MSKKKNVITVDFSNGDACEHVTGSCHLITTSNYNILLECGLSQSNNTLNDYKTNSRKFNFKVKDIDYIFLMHSHLDHTGRVPLLFARGCEATVIVPKGTTRILKDMFYDSAHIMQKDAELLSRQVGREVKPLYVEEDVEAALSHFVEYDFCEKYELSEDLEFQYLHSGHILSGAQLELWIKENNQVKKILYTSDLGNISVPKHYCEKFVPSEKAHLVIAETTYGDKQRRCASMKEREKDLEKIRQVVFNTCVLNKSRVLIPTFALDRAPEILTALYDIFGEDETFNVPIILDSPLMLKHFKSYFNILAEEKLEKLKKVLSWKNIVQVGEWSESKHWAENGVPCVILSASGMMVSGRVITYLPQVLADGFAHILFCGFVSENSLGWKIKNGKDTKVFKINNKLCRNRCSITSLNSFSSHMQHDDLLDYYSSINYEKIALVHGEMKTKLAFAEELQQENSKKNKTGKVIVVNSGVKLRV